MFPTDIDGNHIPRQTREQKTPLYGDNAFEIYKVVGSIQQNIAGSVPTKVVCAARFDIQTKLCNTCCCKNGLLTSKITSVLLQPTVSRAQTCKRPLVQRNGCDSNWNKRLCSTPVQGELRMN